ncbi:hypothetical protein AZH53_03865 [Methanomicrobiaceae archaeon CYW5]|uniref:hypothetical protein n=1 Tax=Methanovulcanius yangii TaxID=1789227 RepID=UPI0029C9F761|nr:hypothetical protein [Methanovulcanius yangii]MBT8507556.1 hypothetical protein [Methanovulcanius yangii]
MIEELLEWLSDFLNFIINERIGNIVGLVILGLLGSIFISFSSIMNQIVGLENSENIAQISDLATALVNLFQGLAAIETIIVFVGLFAGLFYIFQKYIPK